MLYFIFEKLSYTQLNFIWCKLLLAQDNCTHCSSVPNYIVIIENPEAQLYKWDASVTDQSNSLITNQSDLRQLIYEHVGDNFVTNIEVILSVLFLALEFFFFFFVKSLSCTQWTCFKLYDSH